MTQAGTTTEIRYTDPNTGTGIPCTILDSDQDGQYLITLDALAGGVEGWVTAGDIYTVDAYNRMGRYQG